MATTEVTFIIRKELAVKVEIDLKALEDCDEFGKSSLLEAIIADGEELEKRVAQSEKIIEGIRWTGAEVAECNDEATAKILNLELFEYETKPQ